MALSFGPSFERASVPLAVVASAVVRKVATKRRKPAVVARW